MTLINLMPEHMVMMQARRDRVRFYKRCSAAALVMISLWGALAAIHIGTLNRRIAMAQAEIEPLRQKSEWLNNLLQEYERLSEQVRVIDSLHDPVSPASILALLSELTPEEVVFDRIVIEVPPPGAIMAMSQSRARMQTPVNPRGIEVRLDGKTRRGLSITSLVKRMSASEVFRNVRLEDSGETTVGSASAHLFVVSAEIPLTAMYPSIARQEP